jgi:hypothetical protein
LGLIALVQQSGLVTKGARRFAHLLEVYTVGSHRPTRDEDHVMPRLKLWVQFADRFAHPALDPISAGSAADAPSDGEPVSIVIQSIREDRQN